MKTRNNKYFLKSKWVISVILFGMLSGIICLYINENEEYNLMFLLPICYSILTLIFKKMYDNPTYKYGLGFWSANIVMFCRYIITPIAVNMTKTYGRIGPDPSKESFKLAFILMIYELICIFITMRITTYYFKNKNNREDYSFFNNKYLIITLFLILGIIILLPYPGSIIPKNLFLIKTEGGQKLSEYTANGTITAISETVKLVMFLYAISILYKIYNKNKSRLIPFVSLIILIMFLGLKTGASRWAIIINAILGTYLLIKLYPKFKKVIIITIVSIVSISFISISIYKFYYILWDSNNKILDVITEMFTMFEDYFSGPRLVGQAIEMKKFYNINISLNTFINGILMPIPFINNLVNPKDIINIYFNAYNFGYIGQQWLILPMVGEGYSFFGIIGTPIYTILCQILVIIFDYKGSYENKYEFKFIFFYASIWCSLSLGFCSQIVFTWLFSSFIVLYVLFKVNSIISIK
ncbi:hypothetical protein ACV3Z3_04180 [Clostridium perfringens]